MPVGFKFLQCKLFYALSCNDFQEYRNILQMLVFKHVFSLCTQEAYYNLNHANYKYIINTTLHTKHYTVALTIRCSRSAYASTLSRSQNEQVYRISFQISVFNAITHTHTHRRTTRTHARTHACRHTCTIKKVEMYTISHIRQRRVVIGQYIRESKETIFDAV